MDQMKKAETLSRRSFLKGTAIGVLGLGMAGTGLIGCTPSNSGVNNGGDTGGGQTAADDPIVIRQSAAKLNPQDYDYRSRDKELTKLFSEWKFGNLTLSNRIVKSAAGSDTASNRTEMVEYYKSFATGGVVMEYIEDCCDLYAHFPNSKRKRPETVPLKEVADAVHAAGGKVGYQLSSMGYLFSGTNTASLSQFECAIAGDLTLEELHNFQQDHVDAAKFLQSQGIDAIEINAAGNNLGQSFLSRMRNFRTDEYGPQSFANRARFICEIIKGIKDSCGKDFPVQVLMNGIEENDKDIGQSTKFTTVEENKELAKELQAAGADSLHLRLGPTYMHVAEFASDLYFTGYGIEGTTAYGSQFDFSRHWANKLVANHSGCGLMINVASEIKSAVTIPVGCVTYMDPAHAPDLMEQALEDGKIDFMLINRPITVDPDYVNKIKDKRFDEVAPCTRCMHCHFDYGRDGKVYEHCRVNACTQRAYRAAMPEGFDPLPAQGDKKIMVVGAGPAGMEAARIAAQRGYSVTLYEKQGAVGGLLSFANMVKGPHENLEDLRKYLELQQSLSNVTVVTGQEVDADFVKQQNPDAVIIAVGGKADSLGLQGSDSTKIVDVIDFLTAEIGENVCVCGVNVRAFDTAQYLVANGKHVTMVFPDEASALAKGQSSWVKSYSIPMLYSRGTRVFPKAKISAIGNGSITVKGETGVDITVDCDTVINALDLLPNTDLQAALAGIAGLQVISVGDCKDPWNIAEAITAGNLAARNI